MRHEHNINAVRQLEMQNKMLLEQLAKPYMMNANPGIVINDPKGYFAGIVENQKYALQCLIAFRKEIVAKDMIVPEWVIDCIERLEKGI